MRAQSEQRRDVDVSAFPWLSDTIYAAELDSQGIVIRANPALLAAAGGELEGVSISELITREQRAAFAEWVSSVGNDWDRANFSVLDTRDGSTDDRRIWLRRLPSLHLELAAEPAWTENRRLVEQVLQLNDDLIETQRRLSRRQRQLEQAQSETSRSELRVRQLERILLAGLTPRNFDEALQRLLEAAEELLPGDRIDILLHDEALDRLVLRASSGAGPAPDAGDAWRIGEGVLGSIAARAAPALIEDLAHEREDAGAAGRDGSLIGTPLTVEGHVIGVLAVSAAGTGCFSDGDLTLLGLVGERVALAIGQAQLRERERRMAETLQRTMLPRRLPDVPGIAVAARYIARTASVGGDFYDVLALPDGRVGMAIGDITGKGLRAAATMGRLGGALHAYALDSPGPSDVLMRVGRLAEVDDALATALYAVLDPASGALDLASAGHLPPLCVHPEQGVAYLSMEEGLSPLLGLPVAERDQARRTLPLGATLVMFTDGLVERTHNIDEGLAGLAAAAGEAARWPVEDLCDHLLAQLAPAGRYSDDVAVLAVRRLG